MRQVRDTWWWPWLAAIMFLIVHALADLLFYTPKKGVFW